MAVAMTALDARVRLLGPSGERTIPLAGLYRLPGDRPDRETELAAGELITAVPRNGTGEISRFKAYGSKKPR